MEPPPQGQPSQYDSLWKGAGDTGLGRGKQSASDLLSAGERMKITQVFSLMA